MRNPSSLKREFFKKWMMGLKTYTKSNKNMTVTERKKAIKSSADIAMASSTSCATRWSRALIASSCHVADSFLAPKITQNMSSKRILKRSRRVRRIAAARKPSAEWVAKRLVQKRTKMLRGLVPGGEYMDEISLIEETLDYMMALQAQVDVMRCLVNAYMPSSSSSS